MQKKLYALFVLMLMTTIINAQKIISLSTSQLDEFTFKENLLDENFKTKIASSGEFEPYVEIKIQNPSDIESINIIGNTKKYYIFLSTESQSEKSLEELRKNKVYSRTVSTDINNKSIQQIPSKFDGEYVYMLIKAPYNVLLEIQEIEMIGSLQKKDDIPGEGDVFDNDLDCFDGIDNDDDGLKDCEESSCAVGEYIAVNYYPPSCPVCNDGQICIQITNTDRLSFDGGNTWLTYSSGYVCYDGFEAGSYDLIATNDAKCTREYDNNPIVINAPNITPGNSLCDNGDYEVGNFQNWMAGIGFNENGLNGPFEFEDYALNNSEPKFRIINTNNYQDITFPELFTFDLPILGQYAVRLGDDNVIGNQFNEVSEILKLQYCVDVTPENSEYYFVFATLIEDPRELQNHTEESSPFFRYQAVDAEGNIFFNNNVPLDSELVNPVPSDPDDFQYLDWTCGFFDLSSKVGEQVCMEFLNSDCQFWAHWAYTYIDALCTDVTNLTPTVTLNSCSNIVCDDQIHTIEVPSGLYSMYTWEISKIDQLGNESDIFTSEEIIGSSAIIEDLKSYYESNSSFTVACGDKLKVKFIASNQCASTEIEEVFDFVCTDNEVDYCDIVYYCGSELQIVGDVTCEGCTYSWSSTGPGIFDETAKFPELNDYYYANIFNETYSVEVLTPEGCIIKDEVKLESISNLFDISTDRIGCTLLITVQVQSENVSDIHIENTKTNEIFTMNHVPGNSTPTLQYFEYSLDLEDEDVNLILQSNFYINEITPCIGTDNGCNSLFSIGDFSKCNLPEQWLALTPNIFNGDLQVFNPTFWGAKEQNDCYNGFNSPIYYMKMEIYDEWGNLVFQEEEELPLSNENYLLGSEVFWDGTFNGQKAAQGPYGYQIWLKSLVDNDNYCPSCDCAPFPDWWQTYSGLDIFYKGNVTLVR